jgi:hypothetical protein
MLYTIDQSGKVEYTSKPTVIAAANGKPRTLWIAAREKRQLERLFRQAGKPSIFVYKTFAILTFLLIKPQLHHVDSLCLDREYKGKESLIKKYLVEIIRRNDRPVPTIYFDHIGKHSQAHRLAIEVYRRHQEPKRVVTASHVVPWII